MSRILVNHLKAAFDKIFSGKIDMSDYDKKSADEKQKAFYSRALAAYSLHILGSIAPDIAANHIIDGFDDNGIDAIYYDEPQNTLYIVQSKCINEGIGEPDTGELRKFKDGIIDLIEERYEKFNGKFEIHLPSIKDAFENSYIKLNIILAYTGKGFSTHNQNIINELIGKLNESTEWAYFTDFNLKFSHDSLNTILDGKPIDSEITLSNWGSIDEPYSAYYGQISAYDLAQLWNYHRGALFSENIRNFIGVSEINAGILKTIEKEPENFIYFNNGVTVLCNEIIPLPAKTVGRTTGSFDCRGLSVINGAQTIGSLGIAIEKFPSQIEQCKVFVRLVPLNKCPDGFGSRITIASNTQNKIEKRDFITLDPMQQRLRIELLLDGINYHYKRTDEAIPYDKNNCTLEEATVALACLQEDVSECVTAKREIGKLWESIDKEPYKKLFNEKLKPYMLWRAVKSYRIVSKYLSELKPTKSGKESSTCTYGNYFILYLTFKLFPKEILFDPNSKFDQFFIDFFDSNKEKLFKTTFDTAEEMYPTSLIHQLYRNYSKCSELSKEILNRMKS